MGLDQTTEATSRPVLVMMVDDDPNDHLLLTMAARKRQVPIEFAHVGDGGELMLDLAERARSGALPDLILLDLRMPGLDGPMTLQLLGKDPVLSEIPVSVFTSSTRDVDHRMSVEAGARWADSKPSDMDAMAEFAGELVARVQSVDARSAR